VKGRMNRDVFRKCNY